MRVAAATFAVGAALFNVAHACGDDVHGHSHDHSRRSQPGATQATAYPSSPLVWGDVNFIATTDSHGWLIGHTKASEPEPNYSGDFGDFASFVTHMKAEALKRRVDLLLIDSGDLHDGTGLSDGFPPGGVDGTESNKFIEQLPYDILAIGNHELYEYPIALDMYQNFAPKWNGRYLSSNVNITVTDKKTRKPVSVPIGDRFHKFKTLFGRKVTALGVLYNFNGNAANTTVQTVQDMVNETWFKHAIAEEPDFFLLVGHMPVSKDNWPTVFNAIRAVHPTTPIFIFGGRYMETVGWLSAKLDRKGSTAPLKVNRRYLDPNRNTYKYHTQSKAFDTIKGKSITKGITALSNKYNISYVFGTAPQDYFLSRAPYPSNSSVLSLFTDHVLPVGLAISNPARANVPSIAIANSGSQRFDLYQGPFSRNDQFIVSPFDDKFLYVTVPYSVGKQVLGVLNNEGASGKRSLNGEDDPEEYARGYVEGRFNRWKRAQWERAAHDHHDHHHAERADLTLGYVTQDSCPGVGDDTLHTAIPYYDAPDYIASPLPTGVDDDSDLDVIFLDFFESQIISIVNSLQAAKTYTSADAQAYGSVSTNTIFGVYAQAAWN